MEEPEVKFRLTKHLRPEKIQIPFYSGGSLHASSTGERIYALYNFAVVVYDLAQGIILQTINEVRD